MSEDLVIPDGCNVMELENHYHVLFVDNQMPRLTGVELARALRSIGRKDYFSMWIHHTKKNCTLTYQFLKLGSQETLCWQTRASIWLQVLICKPSNLLRLCGANAQIVLAL